MKINLNYLGKLEKMKDVTEELSAVVVYNQEDTDIFMSDGGVATINFNGEHMVTTYYQTRVEDAENNDEVWEIVAEGKAYCKDWEDDQKVMFNMNISGGRSCQNSVRKERR